jgi:twitching motility protein PilT
MVINGRIQQTIIDPGKGTDIHEIIQDGEYYGMQTFDQSLVKLYEQGKIDLRGAMSAASNPHDLKVMLQQRGLMSSTNMRVTPTAEPAPEPAPALVPNGAPAPVAPTPAPQAVG